MHFTSSCNSVNLAKARGAHDFYDVSEPPLKMTLQTNHNFPMKLQVTADWRPVNVTLSKEVTQYGTSK